MDDIQWVFYSIILVIFLVAVVLIVMFFIKRRTSTRTGGRHEMDVMSPRYQAALTSYCNTLQVGSHHRARSPSKA